MTTTTVQAVPLTSKRPEPSVVAPPETKRQKTMITRVAIVLALIAVAFAAWWFLRPQGLPAGIASGNGRIEATEVYSSAKIAGRIRQMLVDEGDYVRPGQIVAYMDTDTLMAQRAEAQANLAQTMTAIQTAQTTVAQRIADRAAQVADVQKQQAQLDVARKRLARSTVLSTEGATSKQERDDDTANVETSAASVTASQAQVAAYTSAIATARSQVIENQSKVAAAKAAIDRIQSDINDSVIRSTVTGRVQYRVAQPGEVVSNGGRLLDVIDLRDVYMTFFLPEEMAGKIPVGSDVRIILDAAPGFVIPATVTFVADIAQFTPKTVETKAEREKLMFRVKANIDPALLMKHLKVVKTGLPGVAYVRYDKGAVWPAKYDIRVPE
jgi:HlyD family secretion protein